MFSFFHKSLLIFRSLALLTLSLMTLILFQNCGGPMSADCETEQCEENMSSSGDGSSGGESGYGAPGSSGGSSSGSSSGSGSGVGSGSGSGYTYGDGSGSGSSGGSSYDDTASPGSGFGSEGSSSGGYTDSSGQTYTGQNNAYYDKVYITFEPRNETVETGRSLQLHVGAVGEPPLTYQWYKDGRAISGGNGALLVKNIVETADAGKYYAVVKDAQGRSVTSRTATVKVEAGRADCDKGKYGRKYNSREPYWVKVNSAFSGYYRQVSEFPADRDSYTVHFACGNSVFSQHNYFSGYSCHGSGFLFQCQNGRWKQIKADCRCFNDK